MIIGKATLEQITHVIQEMIKNGEKPKTILLTPEDASLLHLPSWTRQLLGLKVIVAQNWLRSEVSPHEYTTVTPNKTDPKVLKEYRKSKGLEH